MRRLIYFFIFLLIGKAANTWVYPEHRLIGLISIQGLSNGNRVLLDSL